MVCTKKIVQDKWAILWSKMAHPEKLRISSKNSVKILHNERANKYMKILFFEKKNFVFHLGQFDLFSLETIFYCLIGHGWNWARALSWLLLLNSQDMIRILKQSRHDFSGKYLCEYCIDMWFFCMEVKTHGFVKLL